MINDSYTYEDCLSDYALDYLGFPKDSDSDSPSEESAGKEPAQEADDCGNSV